jgi:hypothetical protein
MTGSGRLATIEMMPLTHRRLVENMFDAYVGWREACDLVNDTYRFWESATGSATIGAFACYSRALDHEERAAAVYAELVRRVRHRAVSPISIGGNPRTPVRKARWR